MLLLDKIHTEFTAAPDVDISNIIQNVQDTVIHLKVDEEQIPDHTKK